jgi:superoxide dismutase
MRFPFYKHIIILLFNIFENSYYFYSYIMNDMKCLYVQLLNIINWKVKKEA